MRVHLDAWITLGIVFRTLIVHAVASSIFKQKLVDAAVAEGLHVRTCVVGRMPAACRRSYGHRGMRMLNVVSLPLL